jgi:hypothetical protein
MLDRGLSLAVPSSPSSKAKQPKVSSSALTDSEGTNEMEGKLNHGDGSLVTGPVMKH